MGLGGVFGMLSGVEVVAMREMCMVSALFVVLPLMMVRRLAVVLCCLLMVLRGFLVMLGTSKSTGTAPALRVNIATMTP
jgi:hypothetical protein